jgi:hypothetical protein
MMTKKVHTLPAASEATNADDLSAELAAMIEREPGDQVRCRNVGGNRYRCNWWSARHGGKFERGGTPCLESTELVVRKSKLLEVSKVNERLLIAELSGRAQVS